jgi:hypothetical protein
MRSAGLIWNLKPRFYSQHKWLGKFRRKQWGQTQQKNWVDAYDRDLTHVTAKELAKKRVGDWRSAPLWFYISHSKDKTFLLANRSMGQCKLLAAQKKSQKASSNKWIAWWAFPSLRWQWEAACNGNTTRNTCSKARESMRADWKESQSPKGRLNKRIERRACPSLHWEAACNT